MKKLTIFLFFASLTLFTVLAEDKTECVADNTLKYQNWIIHANSDFSTFHSEMVQWLEDERDNFRLDYTGMMYSAQMGEMILIESYDYLATPKDIMLGDVVLIRQRSNHKVVEVRWFDGESKQASYNPAVKPCAIMLMPRATNVLF